MRIFETPPPRRSPRIQVINLVDILFILLIFFIASTTFRVASNAPTAVKVTLPEARTAEEIGKEKIPHLSITVAAEGTIYLGKEQKQIGIADLEQALRGAKTKTRTCCWNCRPTRKPATERWSPSSMRRVPPASTTSRPSQRDP